MTILETERLSLRSLDEDDAEFMLDLVNQPSFIRFIGDRGVRTVDEARAYIRKGPVESYEVNGFGLYLVALKQTSVPIGICGLLKRAPLDDADLGFAFLPAYWSRGYAFESAEAVLHHGKSVLGMTRIVAVVAPDNRASIGLLTKLGFVYEGMVRMSEDEPEIRLYSIHPQRP